MHVHATGFSFRSVLLMISIFIFFFKLKKIKHVE